MVKSLLTVISAGLLATANISANAFDIEVVLDDFSTAQSELTVSGGATDTDCPAGIDLGGGVVRCITVTNTGGSLSTSTVIIGGEYSLSNDAGATRGEGSVLWTFATPADLGFASVIQITVAGGDATASLGTPITLSVTSGGNTQSSTQTATAANQVLEYPVSNLNSVTEILMEVDGTQRDGVDVEVTQIGAAGDFEPPNCTDKSFTGVPSDNPLLAGTTFDTSISVETNGADSITLQDAMSSGLALGSAITVPAGCTTSAAAGDSEFTIQCDTASDTALSFSYTTEVTADFADGTLSNRVTSICGSFGGSDVSCGAVAACTDSISRTPPPPIPGITLYGLIAALIGLPMIGGLLIGRRRRA